jgi:ArsR family transcriptional regulator
MKKLDVFKALGDETRLKIIEFLMGGEKCVCEIFPHVERKQSTVSIHLGKLESAGLVASRREGKKIYYKISNEKVRKMMKL